MYHQFLNRMAGNRKDVYTDKKLRPAMQTIPLHLTPS